MLIKKKSTTHYMKTGTDLRARYAYVILGLWGQECTNVWQLTMVIIWWMKYDVMLKNRMVDWKEALVELPCPTCWHSDRWKNIASHCFTKGPNIINSFNDSKWWGEKVMRQVVSRTPTYWKDYKSCRALRAFNRKDLTLSLRHKLACPMCP